jgi:hypothetical protein
LFLDEKEEDTRSTDSSNPFREIGTQVFTNRNATSAPKQECYAWGNVTSNYVRPERKQNGGDRREPTGGVTCTDLVWKVTVPVPLCFLFRELCNCYALGMAGTRKHR